jgi:hypothetical protein
MQTVAGALGWFSLGLGLAEAAAPGFLGEKLGIRKPVLLRAYGFREMAAGVGLLAMRKRAGWMWARVAGDVLDLAALSRSRPVDKAERRGLKLAVAAVLGVTALDLICASRLSARAA